MEQIKGVAAMKEKAAAAAAASAAAAAAAAAEHWTADEITRCSKAMLKYPVGISDRWQKVAAAIGSKTPDEVSGSSCVASCV